MIVIVPYKEILSYIYTVYIYYIPIQLYLNSPLRTAYLYVWCIDKLIKIIKSNLIHFFIDNFALTNFFKLIFGVPYQHKIIKKHYI